MIGSVVPIALQPGIYGLALPIALPILSVNVYLIEGDPLTLIDSGTAGDHSLAALEAGLAALDHRIADLRRLIITHHHVDHAGGAGRIAAIVHDAGGSLDVLAHPRTVKYLDDPIGARIAATAYGDHIFGVEGGVSAAARERMQRADEYLRTLITAVQVTGTLSEGDSITLGESRWQVLHTPGHAADQITFFQPESRAWIAADHLLGSSKSNPLLEPPEHPGDPRVPRLIEYERALKRIDSLNPSIAYPGHGEPIQAVSALIADRIARRESRTDKLFDLLVQAAPSTRTLAGLTDLLFPDTRRRDDYLVYSETLGHLDFLVQDGRVLPDVQPDQTILWQPALQ